MSILSIPVVETRKFLACYWSHFWFCNCFVRSFLASVPKQLSICNCIDLVLCRLAPIGDSSLNSHARGTAYLQPADVYKTTLRMRLRWLTPANFMRLQRELGYSRSWVKPTSFSQLHQKVTTQPPSCPSHFLGSDEPCTGLDLWIAKGGLYLSLLASVLLSKLTSSFPPASQPRGIHSHLINHQHLDTFQIWHSLKIIKSITTSIQFLRPRRHQSIRTRLQLSRRGPHYLFSHETRISISLPDISLSYQVHVSLNWQKQTFDFQLQRRKLFTFHCRNNSSPLS